MFKGKEFVLGNELTQKMGISIANVSMIRRELEAAGNVSAITSLNNCTFVDTTCKELPKFFKQGIANNTFTDLSNKLPVTFIEEEFKATEKELLRSGVVTEKIKIAGKNFYVFSDEFINSVKGKVVYTLDKEDKDLCLASGDIEGFIELSKNKFLTWY